MKTCCSSQSLDRLFAGGEMDLSRFIRYAADELGIPSVEFEDKHFVDTSPGRLKQLRSDAKESGVSIANIAFFCSFGYPTKAEND